jgi:hypothetical protein
MELSNSVLLADRRAASFVNEPFLEPFHSACLVVRRLSRFGSLEGLFNVVSFDSSGLPEVDAPSMNDKIAIADRVWDCMCNGLPWYRSWIGYLALYSVFCSKDCSWINFVHDKSIGGMQGLENPLVSSELSTGVYSEVRREPLVSIK